MEGQAAAGHTVPVAVGMAAVLASEVGHCSIAAVLVLGLDSMLLLAAAGDNKQAEAAHSGLDSLDSPAGSW